MNERKATITAEHRQEAAKLKAIYDQVRPANQGEFGKAHDIGGQTMVANYLNAHSPLNLKAATGFALGLGCKIREFSTRLAAEAHKAAEAAGVVGAEDDFIQVPRLNVSAGAGPGRLSSVVEEDGSLQFRLDFLQSVSVQSKYAAIINVRGGSMEPTIKDGAVILINKADRTPRDGNIYAFVNGEEILVKRFRNRSGEWYAVSDNGDADIFLDGFAQVVVEGRAVWMGAKL
ncbi:hypothetical protein GN316_06540 [Xylophilus sp. Kf1]|nr:hypothetical protein [Xylophilus sp. Kf1]